MRGKCDKCGKIVRFPFQARHKFNYHYRCGGRFEKFYTNKQEVLLKIKQEKLMRK